MRRSCLLLLVSWLGIGLISAPAGATVLERLDDAALARQARAVVLGRVVARSTVTVEGRLWSDSAVEVLEVLKGSLRPGGRVLVRQPGGVAGRVGMRVAGAASFRVGEEVLLFLRWAGARHQPIGMAQGKFTLHRLSSGELRARRDLSGLGLAAFDGAGRLAVRRGGGEERSLDELRRIVRQHGGRP